MLATEAPFRQYFDLDGSPLDDGMLYFGQPNQNPETAPISIYWDAAGTQPAPQPLRTLNGYSVRSGAPANVFTAGDYSLTVRDRRGRLVYYVPNSATYNNDFVLQQQIDAIRTDLANTTDPIKGSGMVGFDFDLNYAVGTIGWAVQRFGVRVEWFGAVGDGVADDRAAIQSAIDFVNNAGNGAGVVYLGPRHRITGGLRIKNGVFVEGFGTGGFPYNPTASKASVLIADFGASVNQWVIDSDTKTIGGVPLAHDAWMTSAQFISTYPALYQVGIRGVNITAVDQTVNIIWGAVRFAGCPDFLCEDVTVVGTGIGYQANCSFGSYIRRAHSETHYFGVINYISANGSRVDGYINKTIAPANLPVPAGRIPSWMPNAAAMTSVLEIDASHATSSKGMIVAGAPGDETQSLLADLILEHWDDSTFHYQSFGTTYSKLYVEGASTDYVLVGANCSVRVEVSNFNAPNAFGYDIGFSGQFDVVKTALFSVATPIKSISDNTSNTNTASLLVRGDDNIGVTSTNNRMEGEEASRLTAAILLDGASLAIGNRYNIVSVARTAGEPAGDYVITFSRPSNATTRRGLPMVTATPVGNALLMAVNWLGGGDGLTNNQCRVRVMTAAGVATNPSNLSVHIFG